MIETESLILRPWQPQDAGALFKYASDARVSELALWPRHESLEMSQEVVRLYFMPNPYCFAMILKDTDEPIGCIGLVPSGDEHYTPADSQREVGYWIGYPYWSKGLTTEALNALICYCRDTLGLKSLLITTDSQNIASQRVAGKCGFEWIEDYNHDNISGKAYSLKLE